MVRGVKVIPKRGSKARKQSGASGVWKWREKAKKPSDEVLEMSGSVSIVYVFKGCSPATTLDG